MRIRDLVAQQGVQSFTADDFNFVTSQLTEDPDRLILVGGQAIEVWGVLFDVPSPIGDYAPLTEDADWLAGPQDAQWLCDKLGGPESVDIQFPEAFDSTPSSALAYLKRGERILMMDFLRTIVGPSIEQVQKLAVNVDVQGNIFAVMHPLLCLESRLANLHVIPSKRVGNGPMQAKWAIEIVHSYLKHLVENNHDKEQVAKACREIAELATFKPCGIYCFKHFSLNPISAITSDIVDYVGGGFSNEEWPRVLLRLNKKQTKWRSQHDLSASNPE